MEKEGMGLVNRSRPLDMSGLNSSSENAHSRDHGSSIDVRQTREVPPHVPPGSSRTSRAGPETLKVHDLPDMEEVQNDVASIVGTLRSLETEDPRKDTVDTGIHDLKRSVAAVKSILNTARFDLNARHKGYFTRDMDRLSGDVRRIVRDIERFERSRVQKEPLVPNMSEVNMDVDGIQKRSESIINEKEEGLQFLKEADHSSGRHDRPGRKVWRIGGFELEPVTMRMVKRFVPILFGILASVAYVVVMLRVVFDLRISHLVPFFIDPGVIFILLVIVLGVTIMANIAHRLRIQYARRSGNPIWDRGGQRS